jgi:hypothetical protein
MWMQLKGLVSWVHVGPFQITLQMHNFEMQQMFLHAFLHKSHMNTESTGNKYLVYLEDTLSSGISLVQEVGASSGNAFRVGHSQNKHP